MHLEAAMRIGFLLDGFVGGGTARVTAILGNELVKSNICDVYALGYTKNEKQDIYSVLFPVQYVYKKTLSMRKAIIQYHYLSKVEQFILDNSIDILIACGTQFFLVASLIAKKHKIKSICWEHTNPMQEDNFRFQKLSRKYGALLSDCNVVLTREALEIYNNWFPKSKNVHIYNPIDPNLMDMQCEYNSSSKKIISVGRLSEPKNFSRLIKIAAIILNNNPEWTWDIFGEGPQREELEKQILMYKLDGKVNLRGQVSDLYNRYKEYSFMVMTSKYEGFPMTLLEGAANSLPLVAFDVSTGPKEIISNGDNGYICNESSDSEMIERIQNLINHPDLRNKMSVMSHRMCHQFDIMKIVKEWGLLLNMLV